MLTNVLKSRWILFIAGMVFSAMIMAACAAAPAAPTTEAEPAEEEAPAEPEAAEEEEAPEAAEEAPATQAEGGTLAAVQERGALRCGVSTELPGFGFLDSDGTNVGFDVDFCRAVAAAALGDASAVEYVPLSAEQRFPALQAGDVDVLIRNTTWTLTRDTDLGLDFVQTTFYDGQGFLVRAEDGFTSLADLDGATICVTSGTTTELNLEDTFSALGLSYEPQVYESTADTHTNFVNGTCDAQTSDKSQLAALASAEEDPTAFVVLPETISKEPLGPVVRANDSQWRDVVNWTVFVMLEAEELGINQENVDSFLESEEVPVQRLLGTGEDDLGALLGVPQDFAYQVISQVGNYGDVYARNLEPIGISREGSFNALYTDGGLLYSPALR